MPNAATRVDFYVLQSTEPSGRLRFACRLAEKAYILSHRIYAHTGTQADARQLDDLLWTFRGGSFVPHELVEPGRIPAAPVTIGCDTNHTGEGDLLINLSEQTLSFYAAFPRVAEIVDRSDGCREAGRQRYQYYRDQGCEMKTHRLG